MAYFDQDQLMNQLQIPGQNQNPWSTGGGNTPGGSAQAFPAGGGTPYGITPSLTGGNTGFAGGNAGGAAMTGGQAPPPAGQSSFVNTSTVPSTPLNVDSSGKLYDANGQQRMSSTGQPIQFGNVSGSYQPPAQTPPVTNGGYNDIPGLFKQILGGIQSPLQSQDQGYQQQLRDSIMGALQRASQPVSANDPLIAPLVQSIQGQSQRAQDRNRDYVGERLYAQGIPTSSGAYDNAVTGFNQQNNEATQGQISNLLVNQLQQRQQQLMSALQTGSQYLTAQQSQQIQSELARMNSAQQLLSQILGNSQFYNQLGTNAGEFAQNQNNKSVGA